MVLIAGAVLINGACILMASDRDTVDVYALQRILIAFGTGLMVIDIHGRLREYLKKVRAENKANK